MSRSHRKRFYTRWHRRLGITSAVFVVLLSISGVLLNHSHHLHLDTRPVHSTWLLGLYGIETPPLLAFPLGTGSVAQMGHQLFINGEAFSECDGALLGAAELTDFSVIACEQELLLVTAAGELVERLTQLHGLPVPLVAAGACGLDLCVQTPEGTFRADAMLSGFSPEQVALSLPAAIDPGETVSGKVLAAYIGEDLTWARVVQDIHAGRFLGALGPWLMDLIALLFVALAGSGAYLWWRNAKRGK